MASIEDIDELIKKHRDVTTQGQPATDARIDEAERFLEVRFPADYRRFLRRWGTPAIGPVEVYGVTEGDFEHSSVPNAIWLTHVKRRQLGLPHELVVLFNGTEYFCLVCNDGHSSPVVVWDAISQTISIQRAKSLFDFIWDEVTEIL